nr:transposase, MuDR, MULE transposase domain protein [Tanacetum cinerariifolium]
MIRNSLETRGGFCVIVCLERTRIPGKSLNEGLVPVMSNQDVLSLLQYVPIYKEIEVYVEKNPMEVVLGTGKGVVIEEVMEDDEVKEASETRNNDFSHETFDMKNKVKAEQEMEELVHNDFYPLMYKDELL